MFTRRQLLQSAAGASALASGYARAQAFPAKPITLVVPYAAGGPTDISSRVLAERMQAALGARVIVENRPGASTIVGAQHVAGAAPDGHTLLMVTTTTLCTNPHLYKKLPYKVEDFTPIGMAVKVPLGFAVPQALPASNIAEFRRYALAQAGKLNYGSAGTGANSQLVNALMNQALGIQMTEVPYKGTGPALVDLAGGRVEGLVDAIATLVPLHREGRIKILANFDDVRSPVAPDVPTFIEAGYPSLVAFTWFAMVAPARVPEPVVAKLHAALMMAVTASETQRKLAEMGFIAQGSTSRELSDYIGSEYKRWGSLIQKMGLTLD